MGQYTRDCRDSVSIPVVQVRNLLGTHEQLRRRAHAFGLEARSSGPSGKTPQCRTRPAGRRPAASATETDSCAASSGGSPEEERPLRLLV